jgi:hypothetical protein
LRSASNLDPLTDVTALHHQLLPNFCRLPTVGVSEISIWRSRRDPINIKISFHAEASHCCQKRFCLSLVESPGLVGPYLESKSLRTTAKTNHSEAPHPLKPRPLCSRPSESISSLVELTDQKPEWRPLRQSRASYGSILLPRRHRCTPLSSASTGNTAATSG